MLYARRLRQKTFAEREAAGEQLWSDNLSNEARNRLRHALNWSDSRDRHFFRMIRQTVLSETGWDSLAGSDLADRDVEECFARGDNERLLTVVEAAVARARFLARWDTRIPDDQQQLWRVIHTDLVEDVGVILEEERFAFELINEEFVPFDSRELHREVVVPTLTLLGGRPEFEAAEKAYSKAIKELQGGDPADAITDACTAVQEALAVFGCKGNTVSKQIDDAVTKGLLAPYDGKLGPWFEADRSTKGDAHNADEAHRTDAWFAVHVAGALILRVASGPSRGQTIK